MGKHHLHSNSAGFSLLEVVVIVMVLALLAGLVAPGARNLIDDGKCQRVAELADTLRSACTRFNMDTDTYAKEGVYDTQDRDGKYSALITDRHQYLLSFQDNVKGWQGPYVDHALVPSDNPFGFPIFVKETLDDVAGGMTGFDLGGSGVTKTGSGNMLVVQLDIQQPSKALEVATKIDDLIDKSGGAAGWQRKGRVNFVAATCKLYIYLYQAP